MTPLPKLSAPALRALSSQGVKFLEDLSNFSEKEVLSWHGVGQNALDLLKVSLTNSGLTFKK